MNGPMTDATDTTGVPEAGENGLPHQFAELERYLEWALPTEPERYLKRINSSMEDLREFYEAVVLRAEEARKYLDDYEYPDLPPEALRLLWMLFSLIAVAYAVDVFGQPRVPDSGAVYIERFAEPASFPA